MIMLLRLTSWVEVRLTPSPVEFWIVPPEPAVVPVPVTARLPLVPVLLSTMPLTAPLVEMLLNVTSFEPIVVLAMLSAVPVEDKAIYLWVAMPDEPEPRAYVLPWSTQVAQQLQDAIADDGVVPRRLAVAPRPLGEIDQRLDAIAHSFRARCFRFKGNPTAD